MMSPPEFNNAETLIVDREPFMRRTVQQYLRQSGIQKINESEDAESALACIRKHRIELLIGDWDILMHNNEFLLQNIKNWASVRGRFAFVVMMGEGRESHVLHAINNGADSIVLKPFSASRFWVCASNALTARQQRNGEAPVAQSA